MPYEEEHAQPDDSGGRGDVEEGADAGVEKVLREEVVAGRVAPNTQVLQEFYANVARKLGSPLP